MGMFDFVKCRRELPGPRGNHPELDWQTKDTPAQALHHYEIREDGSLWHQDDGWEPCVMTGEIRLYRFWDEVRRAGWIEYSAYFVDGALRQMHLIEARVGATDEVE